MKEYRIGIIGAGKLGCSISIGLRNKGIDIVGVYTKSLGSLDFLNEKLDKSFLNDLDKLIYESNVVFITVSDSEIGYIAKQIVNYSKKTL